jgi:hypothetical protein
LSRLPTHSGTEITSWTTAQTSSSGASISARVPNGWAQGQGVGRQVRALAAATADGVSLYVRPEPGNAAEVSLIAQSLEGLRELSGPAAC